MHTVQIKNLTKTFGRTTAIDNLSLNIEKGKITGLIGADAAGKTTLIRLIIGLLLPDSGEVSLLNLNPFTQKPNLVKKIGYMPQNFGLYEDLTVIENLKLYADLKNQPHNFEKMLEFTSLTPFQDRLAGALSGGMKQKLGLACTLLGTPEFLSFFMTLSRGIFLKGMGIEDVILNLIPLIIIAFITLSLASHTFKRKLD